jgi:hypothetical protein
MTGGAVHAQVGDEILVRAHRAVHRRCEVLEVLDLDGGPAYLVRWADDGHEVVYVPGPEVNLLRRRDLRALTS